MKVYYISSQNDLNNQIQKKLFEVSCALMVILFTHSRGNGSVPELIYQFIHYIFI